MAEGEAAPAAEFSADQIEDFKEAFGLFDRIGDSQVAYNQVADIMRALGQNPTNKAVTEILGNPTADDMANKRLNFDAFLPMLKKVDAMPKGTYDDYVEGLRVFDKAFCEIILMEMEAHADAWPFLEPVNPRLVPGYRRIIKNPMDFLTMRERLLQGAYCSCEDFAADAQLVFNNCELFNEDTSEVGMAGHSMRKFFESRWAEFYADKDK